MSKSVSSGIVFLVMGVGLVLGAGYWYWTNYELAEAGTTAQGTVVAAKRYRWRSRGRTRTGYKPVIRFQTSDGKTITFAGSGSGVRPTLGRKVEVIYDPADPSRAKVHSFVSLWFGPLVLLGLGAFCAAIGVVAIRAGKGRAEGRPGTRPSD